MEKKRFAFESVCKRCGECCGLVDGDPCVNLKKYKEGAYYCTVYDERLGIQKTVSGKIFNCVYIREIIKHGCLRPNCAYNDLFAHQI